MECFHKYIYLLNVKYCFILLKQNSIGLSVEMNVIINLF